MNTGRHKAYAAVMARGYRAGLVGVSITGPTTRTTAAPGTWPIDDWR
jgi:hypothetical protein